MAKYNVWTKVAEPGKKETAWHLIESYKELAHEDATKVELTGNRNAGKYGTCVAYQMLPVGRRPL